MLTVSLNAFLKSVALPLAVVAVPFAVGCASSPDKVAQEQREERVELTQEQREEQARLEREHQEERVDLAADQARENVDVAVKDVKQEVNVEADQAKFTIDAKEKLAKFDARIAEARRLGKKVDQPTVNARNSLAAHIKECEEKSLNNEEWVTHREQLKSELAALDNQIDRIEG
jgi:transcriptional antiterminator